MQPDGRSSVVHDLQRPSISNVLANGVTLHVRIAGNAKAGDVLIAINGGPGQSSRYMLSLEQLASADFAVVTYDQRGTGRSAAPSDGYGLLKYVADLEAVRMAVGAEKVNVLGHSWGGIVAMRYATVHPQRVRSIILMGSGPPSRRIAQVSQANLRQRIGQLQRQGIIPSELPTNPSEVLKSILPAYFSDPRFRIPDELKETPYNVTAYEQTLSTLGDWDFTAELAKLDHQVLMLWGEDDPFGLPMVEATRDALSGAEVKLEILKGCGHYWHENPGDFYSHVRAFLELPSADIREFEQQLDKLREELKIPGMSVAVVQRQKVVLARGYGYADLENRIMMTENTPLNIASCTKPFAATVLMKLIEEGKLDLDTPMADLLEDTVFPLQLQDEKTRGYTNACRVLVELGQKKDFPLAPLFKEYRGDREPITVRHHLTHTSQGVPGEAFRYNGFLYGWLSLVAEKASGRTFAESIVEYITAPLEMTRTIPNADTRQRDRILDERAKYYRVNESGDHELSAWPPREIVEMLKRIHPNAADSVGRLNAGAGMISTAGDLARFDLAMTRNQIVTEASKELMFTAARSTTGQPLPYGLGWFVQEYQGVKLVWHYGLAPYAHSSLLLKVPDKELTLILLANSDGASAPFNLGAGDVLASPFAVAFLTRVADMEVRRP